MVHIMGGLHGGRNLFTSWLGIKREKIPVSHNPLWEHTPNDLNPPSRHHLLKVSMPSITNLKTISPAWQPFRDIPDPIYSIEQVTETLCTSTMEVCYSLFLLVLWFGVYVWRLNEIIMEVQYKSRINVIFVILLFIKLQNLKRSWEDYVEAT
jgi:hypothetical protein